MGYPIEISVNCISVSCELELYLKKMEQNRQSPDTTEHLRTLTPWTGYRTWTPNTQTVDFGHLDLWQTQQFGFHPGPA